jgi:hypothetical protein
MKSILRSDRQGGGAGQSAATSDGGRAKGWHHRPGWDALFIALAAVHGGALLTVPSIALIAPGLWWNANTIAHNFIHRPFFRARWLNQVFSAYLTLVLGVPQRLWRERHLAHHGERPRRLRLSGQWVCESLLVAGLWLTLLALDARFLLTTYLPGWLLGLGLCQLQGYYEHARGTTSHYGWLYNLLFFNDGYHREHHARPTLHWRELPEVRACAGEVSRWPAVLRWLENAGLNSLERLVARSTRLQQCVLRSHERAFRALLPQLAGVRRIEVVGGGIFPRTALVLRKLFPHASIRVIEARAEHIALARPFLNGEVEWSQELYDPARANGHADEVDLLVAPLAFIGQRRVFYESPCARAIAVHDWLWRWHSPGVVVSWLLLKRLNLVRR